MAFPSVGVVKRPSRRSGDPWRTPGPGGQPQKSKVKARAVLSFQERYCMVYGTDEARSKIKVALLESRPTADTSFGGLQVGSVP